MSKVSTPFGGPAGAGTVYMVTTGNKSRSVHESVIYSFTSAENGYYPASPLVADANGALYGVATLGGSQECNGGCGLVFKLTPPAESSGNWTQSILYRFRGQAKEDGAYPSAGLVFDRNGTLYGTTRGGGLGSGTVFALTPSAGGFWHESILHVFAGPNDGKLPSAALLIGHDGSLYGSTDAGGLGTNENGDGTIFRLEPSKRMRGEWRETILHRLSGPDGSASISGLVMVGGALYGTTEFGGPGSDLGTVFRLAPKGS